MIPPFIELNTTVYGGKIPQFNKIQPSFEANATIYGGKIQFNIANLQSVFLLKILSYLNVFIGRSGVWGEE